MEFEISSWLCRYLTTLSFLCYPNTYCRRLLPGSLTPGYDTQILIVNRSTYPEYTMDIWVITWYFWRFETTMYVFLTFSGCRRPHSHNRSGALLQSIIIRYRQITAKQWLFEWFFSFKTMHNTPTFTSVKTTHHWGRNLMKIISFDNQPRVGWTCGLSRRWKR